MILGNLSFPGTLNFIGELFSIVSLGNIDYSFIQLLLLNVLLTSCYSFFTMSIVYLVGQAQIYECYKDTNRIECSFIFLLFGIIFRFSFWFALVIIHFNLAIFKLWDFINICSLDEFLHLYIPE